ncbi:hypothetical protein [uncultured Pelagimonas sp.]|uniref:hypothetical protein n=1 Tax=uncultured Pelagimonas sp. TaxID=1618102 RepID=UPI0026143785|nr:hypothetical protein [uncultured Pelagimonas sp.]
MRLIASSALIACTVLIAGSAMAQSMGEIRQYAPGSDLSNLTQNDMNQIGMIMGSSDRESEKRNAVRNVIRKSNKR